MPDRKQRHRKGATAAQLRDDIDRGAAADKVPVFDPAASPLGTDDEAAGSAASPAVLHEERERQRRAKVEAQRSDLALRPLQLAAWLMMACVALALLVVVLLW